jgi:hypothetical protein
MGTTEPIEGFYQERGRIMIDIVPAMDAFIIAKLKQQQYKENEINDMAVVKEMEEAIRLYEQEILRIMNAGNTYLKYK